MVAGLAKIFWGIFIMSVHLNLGSIQILPPFVGLLFIASGAKSLQEETKEGFFQKAYTVAIITSFFSLFGSLGTVAYYLSLYGPVLETLWLMVYSVLEVTTFFYLLSGLILHERAEGRQAMEEELIGRQRTYLLWSILYLCLTLLARTFFLETFLALTPILGLLVRVYLLFVFHQSKKTYLEPMTKEEEAGLLEEE